MGGGDAMVSDCSDGNKATVLHPNRSEVYTDFIAALMNLEYEKPVVLRSQLRSFVVLGCWEHL